MARLRIFLSYSHADSKRKDRLLKHLTALNETAEVGVWDDSQIPVGEKWECAIERAISSASIAILLITADFLSSKFIRNKEVPIFLQRLENNSLRLYPVLAKACDRKAPRWIEKTQIRPIDAKPVWRGGGRYADDELARIAIELRHIVELANKEQNAKDELARQKAEQERREKEAQMADAIRRSPSVESLKSARERLRALEDLEAELSRITALRSKDLIAEEIAIEFQRKIIEKLIKP